MSFFKENEYATYHIQDSILYIVYKSEVSIDLQAAIRIVEDRLRLQEGLAYKVLCDVRGIYEMDKPARDYLAIEGSILVTVVAYVIEPTISKALSAFYLRISSPPIPSRVFSDIEAAKLFLLTK
ncbi:hypothetical protein HZY62_08320 [Maribacter polysiphoniae]|uniref:DUF7793 domain-containing protein n=1 Tax=Maribacter polysiphoniae TaxID=429344 RepID=A0A316EMR5_9FLAO|nr:hypothetical protein [Maribacter polysiphoniae]MBD1260591.1 hypothetical protein [Maribacter polysiphoniae]PWK24280.1 hypothetical protein LX92_01870 [Maribacter polysiphoniae]